MARGCARKQQAFDTKRDAELYIRQHNGKIARNGRPLRLLAAYLCDDCGRWHVTGHPRNGISRK